MVSCQSKPGISGSLQNTKKKNPPKCAVSKPDFHGSTEFQVKLMNLKDTKINLSCLCRFTDTPKTNQKKSSVGESKLSLIEEIAICHGKGHRPHSGICRCHF